MKKLSNKTPPQLRHCPACRRQRPARTFATVSARGERLDLVECLAVDCGLRWCVSSRPAPESIGAAA